MNKSSSGVGAVILAAGASTRMGQPKQLLPFEGRSLLRGAADAALASKCDQVVVVLGANALRVREEVEDLPVLVALNAQWSEGMSASVRAGLKALEASEESAGELLRAAVLLPCDQPHLSAEVLNRLIGAHAASGKAIVVSGYEDIWGVPMLFGRELWPELLALNGKRGAQSVALRHPGEVECVPFSLGALDLDTRDDYERLLVARGSGAVSRSKRNGCP